MTSKTTARIATEVFTANIHHATSISRTMENTQSRERRATANAAKEWEWSKNIRGRKEQMDKKEILDILDNAKDERGAVPMRLVRQAFDKLPTIQPEKAQLSKEGTTKGATSDLIDRKQAIEKFTTTAPQMSVIRIYEAVEILDAMPTVQPEPKEGHWKKDESDDCPIVFQQFRICSVCGTIEMSETNYCPHCGAKMTISK